MLYLSLLIEAFEGRAVHIFDVPGVYLHASLTDYKVVHMEFECEFVEIICEVNPEYEKFMKYEKGKKVLYVLILKAVYVMIESALIWYDFFSTTLSDLGFKLNPYEICIANKLIDEHQYTIRCFVENNKVSHVDENFNSMIADNIKENIWKLSCTTVKKHKFLGLKI